MSKALQTVSFCAAAMKNERVPCQRKLIIFILYGLSQVVNVGRSVIIFGISCLCKWYVELRGWLPVVWLTPELLPSPDHNVWYFFCILLLICIKNPVERRQIFRDGMVRCSSRWWSDGVILYTCFFACFFFFLPNRRACVDVYVLHGGGEGPHILHSGRSTDPWVKI